MTAITQNRESVTDDFDFIRYAAHMAHTARPTAVKRLFALFAQQEKHLRAAGGWFRLKSPVQGGDEAQVPLASASAEDTLRLSRAESRIETTEAKWQKSQKTRGETMKKSTGSRGKRVSFQVTAEPGSDVFVAGTFNNWNPTQYRMRDNPGSGHCKTTLVLPRGQHEYKFVVNGVWMLDPHGTDWAPDGYGTMNSVLHV